MYSIIISFFIYLISSFILAKFFAEYIEKGMLKTFLIFILASCISWVSASLIDYAFPSQAISLITSIAPK